MKRKMLRIPLILFAFLSLFVQLASAQNGSSCYTPLVGSNVSVRPINNNVVCVDLNSNGCNFIDFINAIVDTDTSYAATISTTLAVGSGKGVAVTDNVNTYPAGYYAGFVLNLSGTTLLTADVLSSFTISTYDNGTFKESSTSATLASATAIGVYPASVGSNPGRFYIYFKTTSSFDEVRFVYNNTVSALSSLGILYAMAFDPNCGTLESNGLCGDQIAGPGTYTLFNNGGSLASVVALTTIDSIGNVTDGNKNTGATIALPASVGGLTGLPYIGVIDEKNIYPGGTVAGFVISRPAVATVDVLNNLRIQTYLRGTLQEDRAVSASTLNIGLLTGAGDRSTLSFTTSQPYNEVRLVIATTAAVNLGQLKVYYAFEQPATCTDCRETLTNPTSGTQPYSISTYCNPNFLGACTITPRTSELGVCVSVLGGNYNLANTNRVINNDTTDFASYKYGTGLVSLGIACGFQISVKSTTPFPANTIAGYVIGVDNAGLLDLGLLSGVTIRTFRNNTLVGEATGSNLLSLGLFPSSNGDTKSKIGFKSPGEFDEIQIVFRSGLISAAGVLGLIDNKTFRTYYPFVIRDTDNDGTPDCQDICPLGNDAIDLDGDGIADCNDPVILPLTLSNFAAKATAARKVLLSWETLNETNTRQFILERSSKPAGSANWTTVGTLAAAGTVSGSRTYSFTDIGPIDGVNYYRLRTVDLDGKELISPIRQVNLSSKALLSTNLYPNPVKGGNSIQVATLQPVHYRMLDKTGRTVMSGKMAAGNNTLQAPAASGVYILEVESLQAGAGKETHKIVVQ